jgi:hypothetical protein
MSLQTAPLGQLSGLNLPYSIPTYNKPAGALQQALAAALVDFAGKGGSQLASNLTERDYATAADGGPATGFSRLLGAKVPLAMAQRREGYAHDTAMQESGQKFTHGENVGQQQFTSGENTKQQVFTHGENVLRDAEAMKREVASQQAARALASDQGQHSYLLAKLADMTAMDRQEAATKAQYNDPLRLSEGRNQEAEAQLKEQQALRAQQLMEAAMGKKGVQPQVPGQPQVDPSLLRDRQAQATLPSAQAVQAAAVAPQSNPDLTSIQQFMGQGVIPPQVPQENIPMTSDGTIQTPVTEVQKPVTQQQPYVAPIELLAQLTGAKPSPGQPNVPIPQALLQLIQNVQNPTPGWKSGLKPFDPSTAVYQGYPSP